MKTYVKFRGDLRYEFRDTRLKDKSTTVIVKNRHTLSVIDRAEMDLNYLQTLSDE